MNFAGGPPLQGGVPASSVTLDPSAKDRLRDLLREKAILYSRDGHSIVDYSGKPMRWIYYQWAVSLLPDGAALLADALLEALGGFEGKVVASIGMTGAPLIGALVARGGGRYSGLCVRKERERHGTRRLVEGIADTRQKVVVVDDCIVSGYSLKMAITALEQEGYTVEGALVVTSFPYGNGVAWARALGYRVDALFDVVKDLGAEWDSPAAEAIVAPDGAGRVPPDLTPADAARWTAAYYLREGHAPFAPDTLAGGFDSIGGIAVSFRDRATDRRIARSGFYRFNDSGYSVGQDMVTATIKAIRSAPGSFGAQALHNLKVGVTFFGPHERIGPDSLDFSRYGVLVNNSESRQRHGGALPNTQFFTSEIEQFRHARFTNARLSPHEPFELWRHQVTKSIETGCSWPAFGVSAANSGPTDQFGAAVLRRVRALASDPSESGGASASDSIMENPIPVLGVAVSFYRNGLVGCWVSFGRSLDQMLIDATAKAWDDDRFAAARIGLSPADTDIVVSVFHDCEKLGWTDARAAANKVRLGKDSLFAANEEASAFILAHIPVQHDWDKKTFAQKVLRKAQLGDGPCWWTTYATKSWLSRGGKSFVLESGYTTRIDDVPDASCDDEPGYPALIRQVAAYILGQITLTGLPSYAFHPVHNHATVGGSSVRILLALEALMDAAIALDDPGLEAAAKAGLRCFCEAIYSGEGQPALRLDGGDGSIAEVGLISAVYRAADPELLADKGVMAVRRNLDRLFHADGVISLRSIGQRMQIDHDLFPGSALRMAARIAAIEGGAALPRSLEASLAWYRQRFRLEHPWGMVWWQIQGWKAIQAVTGNVASSPFIYEMADWALEHQLRVNGAFLVDYDTTGPGFYTGCVLEGVADAWALAQAEGYGARSAAYEDSWRRGIRFLKKLICQPDDTFAMVQPEKCVGGVRAALTTSGFRIDYAAHVLSALAKGLVVMRGNAKIAGAESAAPSSHGTV